MLHILGWTVLGLAIGAAAWLVRPARRSMSLAAMLPLSVAGALFGGFVSWIFWDFPVHAGTLDEAFAIPALIGDCLAAFGALMALSLATGAALRGGVRSADHRSSP